jgi:hypothetical protein
MFAVITSKFYTKTMLARIEEHPDYKSTIEDDLFALLKAIKTLMHDQLRTQYFTTTATNAMARAVNIRQGPIEPTNDCTKCFKQECDVPVSFFGEDFLQHLVERQCNATQIFTNLYIS